jgi:ATP:ADP antiporter, AAA family
VPKATFERIEHHLKRVVALEPGEVRGLVASFAYFFCLLTAYYIVRPLREEMGAMLRQADPDALKNVFTYVFLVMLAAVPVFGWLVSTYPRRRIVPIVYAFFIVQLLAFWLFMPHGHGDVSPTLAKGYFVWVSVFNLFVISLFWSVMATYWHADQAKRLYGVIAAGGTIGALTGPIITQVFARVLGPTTLLLVAACFLGLALFIALSMPKLFGQSDGVTDDKPPVTLQSVVDGAARVVKDPFLLRVALWVFLANLLSTFFYTEQLRIVGAAITDRTARVELFSRVDLFVSVLTIIVQILGTAKIIQRFGLGLAVAALPASALIAYIALALSPTLLVILAIVVAERAIHFSLSSPAAKVLWTSVEPDDKYKSQNFIDTVVYRGGDAASGWFFGALGKDGLHMGLAGIAAVSVPLAAVWCWLSFDLAKRFEARTGHLASGKQASGGARG